MTPENDKEKLLEEILGTLRLALYKISAKLILSSKDAGFSDWRLMGRSVGRVERDLEKMFRQADDPERLRRMAIALLAEKTLEAQVKSTYLFARAHSLNRPGEADIHRQLGYLKRRAD